MATFFELAEAIWTQLENRALYPLPEVFANGINPAMRLMALLNPTILTQRYEVTLPAYTLTLDLRQIAPRTHRVLRVMLGSTGGDVPQRTIGQLTPVLSTTRGSLARIDPGWLKRIDMSKRFAMLGQHWVMLSPRAPFDMALTLVCAVVPNAATLGNQTASPDLDASVHDQIADLSAALLRLKEGHGETEASLGSVAALLGVAPQKAEVASWR